MTIRRWTLRDIPAVQQVLLTTWRATYGSFIPSDDIESYFSEHYGEDAFAELFDTPGVDGFVAEEPEGIIGFARTRFDEKTRRFYVISMYVLPGHQGKGIGHGLLKASEGRARAVGADRLWLGVMSQNTAALEWYKRNGFSFVEDEPFTMGNTTIRHLIGYSVIGED